MKSYLLPSFFFRKRWVWFDRPHDVTDASIIYFFSYDKTDVSGFKRKEGLTSLIDLSKPLEEIWGNMRKKFVREQIERGKRRGVTVHVSEDYKSFWNMYSTLTRRLAFDAQPFDALKNGMLFIAQYEGRSIAGGVFISDGTYIRALALASLRLGNESGRARDIVGEANRMIIWEAVQHAKSSGHKVFDLGGVAPDSANPHWRRVAEFKEAFGGYRSPQYYYTKIYSSFLRTYTYLRNFAT